MKKKDTLMFLWAVLIVILTVLVFVPQAESCTAFLDYDYVEGNSRICVYDHLGDPYIITKKSYEICPITVRARH